MRMRDAGFGIRNGEWGMRPEPRKVQGCPVLHAVQGGMENIAARALEECRGGKNPYADFETRGHGE